jgi:hypothetical protein
MDGLEKLLKILEELAIDIESDIESLDDLIRSGRECWYEEALNILIGASLDLSDALNSILKFMASQSYPLCIELDKDNFDIGSRT